ncbi:MAG: hypothetical protein DRP49_02830 [Spirochaetes bacterium]|nr:MAG: hypothetical protein DRP49_02830 [Spirochaetota bacterium]
MKIVEQYLRAVSYKLPWKSRKDIIEELRSLLMDQIESDFGVDAGEKEVKKVITNFGSPSEVAARYKKSKQVISPGLTDLYLMIMAIMAGGMFIAFTTVFVVEALQDLPEGRELAKRVFLVFSNTLGTWIGGVGGLTLVFIVLSRFFSGTIDTDENWSVKDLKDIRLEEKLESTVGSIFSIVFLFILIVLMNLYPSIITLGENLFSRSGFALGHRVIVEVFRRYIGLLTVLWTLGIVFRVIVLYKGEKFKWLKFFEAGLSAAEALLAGIMLFDHRLYSYEQGWIGFKVVLVIVLVVNLVEVGSRFFQMLRNRVVES